ncbi:MAG: peroxiredoxin-like family protein [Desulfomonilaceae bacterium]
MELRSLQRRIDEITELGASLAAISSETPDDSLSVVEKNELSFEVLSDVDNTVAREFGIVFRLPVDLFQFYSSYGVKLPKNGEGHFELPVPATYIIGRDGKILKAYVEIDYTKRLDPDEIIEFLQSI